MGIKSLQNIFCSIRRCVLAAVVIAGIVFPASRVFAQSVDVSTLEELQGYFNTGGEVKLTSDITLSSNAFIRSVLVLDLNGHTLDAGGYTIVPYGALLVVEDSTTEQLGKITGSAAGAFTIQVGQGETGGGFTLNSGTIDCTGSNYCVRNYGTVTMNGGVIEGDDYVFYNHKDLVMNNGRITAQTELAVGLYEEGATFEMNGGKVETMGDYLAISLARPNTTFTMNGGEIEALFSNGDTSGGGAIGAFKYSTVTINNGTVTAYSNTITGNGSASGNSEGTGAKFNINGGTIISQSAAAIYAPQVQGVTTMTGGTLIGKTGIEIRAGTLNISGGKIVTDGEYNVTDNRNGLTTYGTAISVAQHTTAQPITVSITGGEFESSRPVSSVNPLGLDESVVDQIRIYIKGGKFVGDDLEGVTENIPRGYTEMDAGDGEVVVVPINSGGYYLSANMGDSIEMSGIGETVATDYSEINVLSNCSAGYDVILSTTTDDNLLYQDGTNKEAKAISPIEGSAVLSSAPDTWGYFMSSDISYVPTGADTFRTVPLVSNPVLIKSAASTASEGDINDTFRVYFGVNIGSDLAAGEYRMATDESGKRGGILYQIVASPNCTTFPVEVTFNQNLDGNGGEGTDDTLEDFPTSSENILRTDNNTGVTTLRLSDNIPGRDRKEFVEWNTSPSGAGTSYSPDQVITVGTGEGEIIGEVTLYAIWKDGCSKATICYDANGADAGSVSDQTVINGSSAMLVASTLSRDGYGFAGWNTEPDGSGVSYGPEDTITMPSRGGVKLYANWIESAGTLQKWSGASTMEIGDVTALTDNRDGETYTVAKLADGKVWMVENLRLVPADVNFSIFNTNKPTSAFISGAASSSGSSNTLCGNNNATCFNTVSYNDNNLDRTLTQSPTNNDSGSSWYPYGVMYNWYTATAGNGTYDLKSNTTAVGDICPAGWHLPTGNNGEFVALNNAVSVGVSNDSKLRSFPNNFLRSGDYNTTAGSGRGTQGRFWSSTASDNSKAYRFGYDGNSVTANNTYNKWDAFAVRCIYDGDRIPISNVEVTLGEHVTSVSFSNAIYGTQQVTTSGESVILVDNLTYEVTAVLESGYTIDAWTTGTGGQLGSTTTVSTSYVVSGDTTLAISAKVATLTTYTLSYDVGASADTITDESASSYNATYTFDISEIVPVIFGSTFVGWSETSGAVTADYVAGGTITLVNDDPDNVSAVTKTLYAVYVEDSCGVGKICYFGNGATGGTMPDQTASSNTSTLLTASNYSRAGYGFAGWITSENATPYGPNATITTPDLSAEGLKLYAKWVASAGDLQSWGGCSAMSAGDVTALTDTRDGNTYAVAKLADNRCWMVENLRLDPSTADITSLNTHSPSGTFATEAANSSPVSTMCATDNAACDDQIVFNTNNFNRSLTQRPDGSGSQVAWYSYGVYYNWYTATAGTGLYSTTGTNASGDICPTGWHIPTGNTTGEYSALNAAANGGLTNKDMGLRDYPNNFVYSGEYKNSTRANGNTQTRIWTSTASSDAKDAYRMGFANNTVTPAGTYRKWEGFAVRCIYNNN